VDQAAATCAGAAARLPLILRKRGELATGYVAALTNNGVEKLAMRTSRSILAAAALLLACAPALSQPGPGAGRCGPGAAASGTTANCPMGRNMGPGTRWGRTQTPGWSMMTEAERQEHATRMRGFKNYEECKAYVDQHREQMAARAKERGQTVPAQPRRDPCGGLKATQK
jgi:hypothetical protein